MPKDIVRACNVKWRLRCQCLKLPVVGDNCTLVLVHLVLSLCKRTLVHRPGIQRKAPFLKNVGRGGLWASRRFWVAPAVVGRWRRALSLDMVVGEDGARDRKTRKTQVFLERFQDFS